MLIDTARLTDRDRAHWERLAHYDDALSRDPALTRMEQQGVAAVTRFAETGEPWSVSVSWGKDSVVAAHLALLAVPTARLVWARAKDVETPETEQVRDSFLATHPSARYEEIEYEFRVPLRFEPGHTTAPTQDALKETLTGRYVSGLRAQESRTRRISIGHRGLVTTNTCRPIGRWDATHIFAYLTRQDLPIHPAYAMTAGGHYDRQWLRVHPLGTAGPAQSAVHTHDPAAWENTYYPDVLAAARRARAHLWGTP